MIIRLALQSTSPRIPATTFFLFPGTFIIGRSSKCDFVVRDDTVSRRHAQIIVNPTEISVRDLDSRNGTYVDDQLVTAGTVRKGENVKFGSVSFMLSQGGNNEDEPDSEAETVKDKLADCVSDPQPVDLSKAQRRVVQMLLRGLSEKRVAVQLKLSSATIHNHIQAIYRAFKVHSRSELLVLLLSKTGT